MTTSQQNRSAFMILAAVTEAVRSAGRVPSGTIYAALLGKVSLEGYQSMLRTLKGAGLVKEVAHELIWIGPVIEDRGEPTVPFVDSPEDLGVAP